MAGVSTTPSDDSLDQEEDDPGDYSESVDEVPCPFCQKPMADLATICPHCGHFVSREDTPREPPSVARWVIIGLLVFATIFGIALATR
jgi:hypothetical protein